ncbi:hypothetical protein THAOC_33546 [Thalassiosira oceanica]|uniref:CCHC-type domain-containing protein n=1 Tax=Thalassiosira oceanica TaxID=159749 RepID=K0R412_THAOC|nr:hypothetical protein THAOC_33546 [Thalassiosira oceanica]|eukprot:EJK47718.1 hypothetical protein THAOC_33546 [Thalassiosira oceanica]
MGPGFQGRGDWGHGGGRGGGWNHHPGWGGRGPPPGRGGYNHPDDWGRKRNFDAMQGRGGWDGPPGGPGRFGGRGFGPPGGRGFGPPGRGYGPPQGRGFPGRGYDPSFVCYKCGEYGHIARNCPHQKKTGK